MYLNAKCIQKQSYCHISIFVVLQVFSETVDPFQQVIVA